MALHLEVHRTPRRAKEELTQLSSSAEAKTLLITHYYSKLLFSLVPSTTIPDNHLREAAVNLK